VFRELGENEVLVGTFWIADAAFIMTTNHHSMIIVRIPGAGMRGFVVFSSTISAGIALAMTFRGGRGRYFFLF
jgi:hypothetical protein